ncbi:SGNH hydrolase [Durotheca rogersii]|uniref:SGNH hydrolase n=1 Tax=Durotheca rogersii TaxID=419775 RepID=UPI0022203D57|nr:SGNH hydrolase [Durotheca rogersii]KAI5862606.1 SGNH hydrolase [Durotheca rogersii]
MPPPSKPRRRQLRILCFGDSLTSGFPAAQPYAGKLEETLEVALRGDNGGAGVEVQCEVEGVPGDKVTNGTYLSRMRSAWSPEEWYDWTIVLGGTNDLGWGHPAENILASLKDVWDIPLSRAGKVLALTVPDTRVRMGSLVERRGKLNTAIKEYKRENFFYYDLHAGLPYHDMLPADRPRYWHMDGLHLTAEGYDLMGERIGGALARILHLAEAQGTELVRSPLSRAERRAAAERALLEEERGDPKLLSQGYIVVRKGDLD